MLFSKHFGFAAHLSWRNFLGCSDLKEFDKFRSLEVSGFLTFVVLNGVWEVNWLVAIYFLVVLFWASELMSGAGSSWRNLDQERCRLRTGMVLIDCVELFSCCYVQIVSGVTLFIKNCFYLNFCTTFDLVDLLRSVSTGILILSYTGHKYLVEWWTRGVAAGVERKQHCKDGSYVTMRVSVRWEQMQDKDKDNSGVIIPGN